MSLSEFELKKTWNKEKLTFWGCEPSDDNFLRSDFFVKSEQIFVELHVDGNFLYSTSYLLFVRNFVTVSYGHNTTIDGSE